MTLRHRNLAIALTVCLGSLCGLLVAEIVLRVLVATPVLDDSGFARFLRQKQSQQLSVLQGGGRLYRESENPRLGWELLPGAAVGHVQVNRLGFRGPEPTPRPAFGTRRVAVLGDSETLCMALPASESFPAALGRSLEEALGVPVEPLNFGVSGYNSAQELELLRRRVLPLHPDLVVLYYVFNDPELSSPVLVLRNRALGRSYLYLLVQYTRRFDVPTGELLGQSQSTVEYYFRLHDSAYFTTTSELLTEMAAILARRRIPFVVVVSPELVGYHGAASYPYRPVHEKLAALELPVCDPLDAFLERVEDPMDLWVADEDHHKNGVANRWIAQAVAPCVAGFLR